MLTSLAPQLILTAKMALTPQMASNPASGTRGGTFRVSIQLHSMEDRECALGVLRMIRNLAVLEDRVPSGALRASRLRDHEMERTPTCRGLRAPTRRVNSTEGLRG